MCRDAAIHFRDNTPLQTAREATYLSNNLNHIIDLKREVCQRIQDKKRTWQKLTLFWKDSNTNKKWQLIVYDAVIKSKLLYSLETTYITESLTNKLDAFHLRGLRKIWKLSTTYIDRRNTNLRVYELASRTAYRNDPHRKFKRFSQRNLKRGGFVWQDTCKSG